EEYPNLRVQRTNSTYPKSRTSGLTRGPAKPYYETRMPPYSGTGLYPLVVHPESSIIGSSSSNSIIGSSSSSLNSIICSSSSSSSSSIIGLSSSSSSSIYEGRPSATAGRIEPVGGGKLGKVGQLFAGIRKVVGSVGKYG